MPSFSLSSLIKDKTFVGIWLMFYINIHCGLALITYEKQILGTAFSGKTAAFASVMIAVVPSVTAAFNALGRIGYSTISDHCKDRNTIYKIIFTSSILVSILAFATQAISNGQNALVYGVIVIILLVVVNAGYGGGFSTLPALLSTRFGMERISKIHGLVLSAWAVAGITGNNMSEIILSKTGKHYDTILIATIALYIIAFIVCNLLVGKQKEARV